MGCNCGKYRKVNKDYEDAVKMASIESVKDKASYIIYELEGKIYYDKVSCWQKAGRAGVAKDIIPFV